MKLFISHSSKDSKIAKCVVDLLYGIGLKENDMFCSTIAEIGIPINNDIYDYLQNMLKDEELYIIFLLSDQYYQSAACLNEMGAVWVNKKAYITFLLPGYDYSDIKGAINPRRISIKLDDDYKTLKHRLGEFKTDMLKQFSLTISDTRWEELRDQFMKSIDFDTNIPLDQSEGLCIGELIHEGCVVDDEHTSRNEVSYFIDFNKTKSDLCSIVINPQLNNWTSYRINNKKLYFDIFSDNAMLNVKIELQVTSANKNFKKKVTLNERNSIILSEFCADPEKWKYVKEVNFLIERQDVCNPSRVTIKNLCIQ